MNNTQQALKRLFSTNANDELHDPGDAVQPADTEAIDPDQDANADTVDPYADLDHTERGLSENPVARSLFWVVLVLGLGGGGLYLANSFDFASLTKSNSNSTKAEAKPLDPEDETIESDATEARIAFGDQDLEQSKATAMLDAEERAKKFDEAQTSANSAVANPPKPAGNQPRANVASAGTPRKPVTSANTVGVPRRSYTPPRTSYTPPARPSRPARIARPATPIANPKPPAQAPPPQPVKTNPYELYAQLDNVGSYGQSDWLGTGKGNQQASQQASSSASDSFPSTQSVANNFESSGGIDGGFLSGTEQEIYMVPGETLELTLNLPIVWTNNQPAQKTLATVTKGNQYLPSGTQLTVSASGDSSGIVQVNQLEIVDGNDLIPLNGSMQITKANGKPLKAKKEGGPGFFAKTGVKTLLGLGANVASSALSGNTVTVNNGNVTTRNNKGALSSVLREGADTLTGDLEASNQAAIQQRQNQEYFIVEQGKSIKVAAVSNVGG